VKIFLVEDSALLRGRLEAILSAIPGVQTVGHASGAKEAVQAILASRRRSTC
jgi:DNA-binding NarL/FixJ family response regulator